jgi:uncharacterized protein (DUF362 family)
MHKVKAGSGIPVALARCTDYQSPALPEAVGSLLKTIGCQPGRGSKVLVKPNLLAARPPDFLPCTHPLVVRAACQYLLELGARVTVGDSPTFGEGLKNARKIGLEKALADLPVSMVKLNRVKVVRLSFAGGIVPLSRQALENDLILSLPKLKVHRMTGITGAVKNFYGCVPGIRKPLLHVLYGGRGSRFESLIVELQEHLPPSMSLMDAVVAMHVRGPVNGEPYSLGLLAASPSAVALDTAVYTLLGLQAAEVPLWQEALVRDLPGGKPEDIFYPLESLDSFEARGFQMPATLQSLGFHPLRLVRNSVKHAIFACGWKR